MESINDPCKKCFYYEIVGEYPFCHHADYYPGRCGMETCVKCNKVVDNFSIIDRNIICTDCMEDTLSDDL